MKNLIRVAFVGGILVLALIFVAVFVNQANESGSVEPATAAIQVRNTVGQARNDATALARKAFHISQSEWQATPISLTPPLDEVLQIASADTVVGLDRTARSLVPESGPSPRIEPEPIPDALSVVKKLLEAYDSLEIAK